MFDKHLNVSGSLRNVRGESGRVGYAFDSRIAYYRGLGTELEEAFDDRWPFAEAETIGIRHLGGVGRR